VGAGWGWMGLKAGAGGGLCGMVWGMRQQFWFWFGYRPGSRTVARQAMC
jgi:hypothetical protein